MIDSPLVFDAALVAIVLVGAFLVLRPSMTARRKRRAVPVATELPTALDTAAAWTVDRALKALAASAAREGVVLPPVVAVTVDGERVGVQPATPTVAPPAPWVAIDGGRLWSAHHAQLQVVPLDEATAQPYPGLVTLGITAEGRMLLDLDHAHGLIALQGEPIDRTEAVRRLVREFTTNPWSAPHPVALVDLPEFAVRGVDADGDIDDVLAAIAEGGRGIAVLRDAPVGQRAADLAELLAAETSAWSVLVVGTARQARWRFTAEKDGRISSDYFPDASWTVRVAPELATA